MTRRTVNGFEESEQVQHTTQLQMPCLFILSSKNNDNNKTQDKNKKMVTTQHKYSMNIPILQMARSTPVCALSKKVVHKERKAHMSISMLQKDSVHDASFSYTIKPSHSHTTRAVIPFLSLLSSPHFPEPHTLFLISAPRPLFRALFVHHLNPRSLKFTFITLLPPLLLSPSLGLFIHAFLFSAPARDQ